ncbi:hypothetical protein FACS1894137_18950 [Spirochaetia bacterium]|nr:hypothetical protein FACS1894137_18950 [Spirochaetia bacterium]
MVFRWFLTPQNITPLTKLKLRKEDKLRKDDGMKKKRLLLSLVVLFAISATVFAQVCIVRSVTVSGYGTNTVTFINNGFNATYVKVEVKWDNEKYSRIFGRDVPAGHNEGTGKNLRFIPGKLEEPVGGLISSINECP